MPEEKFEEVAVAVEAVNVNGGVYGDAAESLGGIATFVYKGGSYQYFNTATGSNIDPWYNVKKAGTVVVEGELFGIVPAPIRPQTTDNTNGVYQYPGAVEYCGVWKLPFNYGDDKTGADITNYTRGVRVYWVPANGDVEGYVSVAEELTEDGTYVAAGIIETAVKTGENTVTVILTPGAPAYVKTTPPGP